MAASSALASVVDVESFIYEYFGAWEGTDEERILSYYSENCTVQIPGALMQGRAAIREQFVRPFITAFPGNRHVVRNWIFGRGVVVVEWSFEAQHKGPFEGREATDARIEAPGCGVYEYDSARRQITSARIYLDMGTLLKQILDQHPRSTTDEATTQAGTIAATGEHLDLATVIAVSETVSGEMVLERLLDTLMRTAVEHARAERALLILSRKPGQRIAAEATTINDTIRNDTVVVRLCDEPVTGSLLPETILGHVLHTRESVILDDASATNPFSMDSYIARRHARSVFCLPIMNQAKLIGALYLENRSPRVFAPARTAVLRLLASQAAISLENSRLYRDLAERESRIRRLVDANIIGIFIWELEGRILEANDAFLSMLGYDREDLVAGRLHWTDLTPPEWRDRDERQWMPELRLKGRLQPFEKEYFRKDGNRVPVLIGVATFEETGNHGVAYVLDLTERKRAQDAMSKASAELARVSRITALSALTASIAHEVNQPLSGIITNASTCLRMLDSSPPNIDGARQTAQRTIRDGNRASDVIARLRALFSKREFTLESLDLNDAAREVIALSSNDLQRNRIILEPELADDLPPVTGDRIQLQQVILNLLRNASDAMVDVHDRARELLIRTEREEGDRVRLTIRDAGTGLSPESLTLLFDPFYTTKSGGMGIGLFVSRSIIERHHGRLWAEPNEGAPGATFSFSIPRPSLQVESGEFPHVARHQRAHEST
jgi:PAS domain S-box-containing protein